jgi:DNA polymerase-3 subunit gamma/tau
MERYVVSARKYRPQTFESVVGQQHITNTLESAIAQNHLAQALLFCGPRGVGKTTCARILAKKINESDNVSEEDFSLNIFELDAASNNSVDDIRRLIDQVRFAPQVGQFKVYIIDEVHMLSQAAFNAFLKTLEEPPAHAIFILATTEKHKIIPTILSRCQIFDFKRITVDDIAHHLSYVAKQENIEADEEGLHVVAQKADGALRDALSIFDRLVAFSGDKITYQNVITNLDILDYDYYFKTTELVLAKDLTNLLILFHEILNKGFDGIQYINGFASHLRDLLVSKDQQTVELLEVGPSVKERYLKQSQACGIVFLVEALKVLNECDVRYKSTSNQRLLVEVTLMQLVQLLEKKKPELSQPQEKVEKPAATSSKPKELQQTVTIEAKVAEAPIKPIEKESLEENAKSTSPHAEEFEKRQTTSIAQTEPVAQVNVSEKATEEAQTNSATKEVEEQPKQSEATEIAKEPKPKAGNQPDWLAKLQGNSISINTTEKKISHDDAADEDAEDAEPKGPAEVFSERDFDLTWDAFLASVKSRKSIYAMLATKRPKLKNLVEMHIELENKTQESYLQNIQAEMMGFMRKKLNNYKLKVISTIKESIRERRPYTAEERYKAMVEINPQLDALRRALDTDIE